MVKKGFFSLSEMAFDLTKVLYFTLLIMVAEQCQPSTNEEEPLLTAVEEQSVLDNRAGTSNCIGRIELMTESGRSAR